MTAGEKAARAKARAEARAVIKALEAEQWHAQRLATHEQWWCEGMYLTRAEFEAGEPCRGVWSAPPGRQGQLDAADEDGRGDEGDV